MFAITSGSRIRLVPAGEITDDNFLNSISIFPGGWRSPIAWQNYFAACDLYGW